MGRALIRIWRWSREGLTEVAGPAAGEPAGPEQAGHRAGDRADDPSGRHAAGRSRDLPGQHDRAAEPGTGQEAAVLWVDVRAPAPSDWAALRRRYALAPLLWNRLEAGAATYGLEAAGGTVVFHVPLVSGRSCLVMLMPREVATVCEGEADEWQRLRERLAAGGPAVPRSAPWLLYFLLEDLLHAYGDQVQRLEHRLEPVESRFLGEEPVPAAPQRSAPARPRRSRPPADLGVALLSSLHRRAGQLHRRLNSLGEVLDRLLESGYDGDREGIASRELRTYLRALRDHANRLSARLENARELVVTLMNLRLALAAERTNRLILRLTVLSTIFLPLTFLTGIYGMNFRYMPELNWPWAYPALLAFMLVLGLALWWVFRREYE